MKRTLITIGLALALVAVSIAIPSSPELEILKKSIWFLALFLATAGVMKAKQVDRKESGASSPDSIESARSDHAASRSFTVTLVVSVVALTCSLIFFPGQWSAPLLILAIIAISILAYWMLYLQGKVRS